MKPFALQMAEFNAASAKILATELATLAEFMIERGDDRREIETTIALQAATLREQIVQSRGRIERQLMNPDAPCVALN